MIENFLMVLTLRGEDGNCSGDGGTCWSRASGGCESSAGGAGNLEESATQHRGG